LGYLTTVESAATVVAAGAVTVTSASGSSSILLLSVEVSFFEHPANTKPPINANANNFFIVNLIWAKIEISKGTASLYKFYHPAFGRLFLIIPDIN